MRLRKDILNYINEKQKGKSGIYPILLAEEVAARFTITMKRASACVCKHIKDVMGEKDNASNNR